MTSDLFSQPIRFFPWETIPLFDGLRQAGHKHKLKAGILCSVTKRDLKEKTCENCQKKMPQTLFDDWKNQVRKNLELEREQEEDPAKIFTRWCGLCLVNFTPPGDKEEVKDYSFDDRVHTCSACHWLLTHNPDCSYSKIADEFIPSSSTK